MLKKYLPIIAKSPFFQGIEQEELLPLLSCLEMQKREYKKGEFIIHAGEHVKSVGLLVEGSALILQEDYWGNRNIITKVFLGEVFGESFACLPNEVSNVSVQMEEASVVIFMDVKRILTTCPKGCSFHTRMIRNLLNELAKKNIRTQRKIMHMSKRSTRDKLLSYLSEEAIRQGKPDFHIPFNRQQLADYLSVDRSAMSNELCKLREEGSLSFQKNHFILQRD